MPVVPITSARNAPRPPGISQAVPPPAEPFALMAAATMHSEGRLIKSEPTGKSPLNE
jgi:hypothetical protein